MLPGLGYPRSTTPTSRSGRSRLRDPRAIVAPLPGDPSMGHFVPMAKKTAQPKIPKAAKKKTPPPRSKATQAPPMPSWIRAHVTAARTRGRPRKLTRPFIAEFVGYLERGLHLSQCGALCGVAPQMVSAWLRTGRDDEEKGRTSIERDFSAAVRAGIATLQLRGVDTLAVYQRMAEGWDPTCTDCIQAGKGCGSHPKQLKLAADIQRWQMSHRFPREWAPGTVPALLAGDQDGGAPAASSLGDGVPAPAAFGALVFLPARREDLE